MKNEAIRKIVYALKKNGCFSQEQVEIANNILITSLEEYDITRETKELAIYEEDTNSRMIKKFITVKSIAGRSDKTVKAYKNYLEYIFRYINKSCLEVTTDDIRLYFAMRTMQDKLSKVSVDNERRVLCSFYKFLLEEEIITKNPMLKIEPTKKPKRRKKAFTEIEIEKIRRACKTKRDAALIEFLLSTGCRASEAASVKISELKGDEVTIVGKGDKERTVYINAKAQLAIKEWLDEKSDNDLRLFSVGASGIEGAIRKIGKMAAVENTHPHRFRRTCATFAMRRGMPIEQVSQMLGHENLQTTKVYLDLDTQDIKNSHKKYVI